jgi:DNA-binding response OmpR family regulator
VVVASGDVDARELLSRVLARAGHETEQVDSPAAAVEAISAHRRLALVALFHDDRAVALVSDLRAAEEPEVAVTPLVVVTDDDATAAAAAAAGADGTLTRPFHADELTDEFETVLARSPEERAELRAAAGAGADD